MPIRSEKPLDNSGQVWRGIDDKFPKKIHNATATSDGLMSAEDKAKLDSIDANDDNRVYDIASWESDGLLSKEDKKKLDSVEQNANNYIHPNTPEIRHVTDEQITYWNAKASTDTATQKVNGLMSAADKKKLDGVEKNANNYIHPNTPEIRHVTDEQIEYWNNKAEKDVATQTTDGLMSATDKDKLDRIEEGANKYVHPNNEGIRHVSDAEKDYWNSKADKVIVTNSENGLMSFIDKIKLDGIEDNANNYIHPDDENHRHVTDDQIKFWDSKGGTEVASHDKNGLMSKEDKKKLDSIDPGISNYEHPEVHPATMIVEDSNHRFITDKEREKWDNAASSSKLATPESDGLLSKEDKAKLDEITNPRTHELSLSYSKWSEEAPYIQTLTVPGIHPKSNTYIGINPTATVEEMTMAAEAKLKVESVEEDKITITATGERPDKNLPIIIMTGTNILIFEVNQYNNSEEYSDDVPVNGYHYQNQKVYSNKPVQTKCIGWICTESGEPGKWTPFGII